MSVPPPFTLASSFAQSFVCFETGSHYIVSVGIELSV